MLTSINKGEKRKEKAMATFRAWGEAQQPETVYPGRGIVLEENSPSAFWPTANSPAKNYFQGELLPGRGSVGHGSGQPGPGRGGQVPRPWEQRGGRRGPPAPGHSAGSAYPPNSPRLSPRYSKPTPRPLLHQTPAQGLLFSDADAQPTNCPIVAPKSA